MKRFFKIILWFLFSILFVFVLSAVGSFIYLKITEKNATDFVPADALAYGNIKSTSNLFNTWTTLRASDLLFSFDGVNKFVNFYQEAKTNTYLNSKLGNFLIDMDIHFLLLNTNSPVVIINTGYKSIPINIATKFINNFEKENFKILKVEEFSDNVKCFELFLKDAPIGFLVIKNNLVFFSQYLENISDCFYANENYDILSEDESWLALSKKSKKSYLISVYVKSNSFIQNFNSTNTIFTNIKSIVSFEDWTLINLNISNDKINCEMLTKVKSNNIYLNEIMKYSPPNMKIINLFPDETNYFATGQFNSFEELAKLALFVNGFDPENILKTINNTSNFLLGINKDELINSWMGNEAGVLNFKNQSDPIIFIKAKDINEWKRVMAKVNSSAVLDTVSNIVIDNVRITQIIIPDFFKPISNLFLKGMTTPYYIEQDDYIFFCMTPEPLSMIKKSLIVGDKLNIQRKGIKDVKTNSNMVFYYDLTKKLPTNLVSNMKFIQLIQLYQNAFASIDINNDYLEIKIATTGANMLATNQIPSFPKKFSKKIVGDIFHASLNGNKSSQIIYIDEDKVLNSVDSSGAVYQFKLEEKTRINHDDKFIYAFLETGIIFKFDYKLNIIEPFPLYSQFSTSFTPPLQNDSFILFSQKDNSLYKLTKYGEEKKINFSFEGNVLYAPKSHENYLALYPKRLTNQIFLIDSESGEIVNNWPVIVNGPSFNSPSFYEGTAETKVLFLTQSGTLHSFDFYGNESPNFPIELNSTFYADIAFLKSKENGTEICVIDKNGKLFILDNIGTVKRMLDLPNASSKETKIITQDCDLDGNDEIFVYGDYNYILGFDYQLNSLKDFPVAGIGRPIFQDIDFNSTLEMIAKINDYEINGYFIGRN